MLRWTPWGAVAEPEILQIRVAPDFLGRVPAGAPVPSRALTPDEVEGNLRHFTEGRRGPRSCPCRGLVLAGVEDPEPLVPLVERARGWGVDRVVLHLGAAAPRLAGTALAEAVDERVARVASVDEARALEGLGALDVVVLLEAPVLPELRAIADVLAGGAARRVVFTWPLAGDDVPPAVDAAAAVRPALDRLRDAGVQAGVKGIPLCTLAPRPVDLERWEPRVWRSPNRFYVDADHQHDAALVFFPELVRFAKADSCRWCTALERCDGVVDAWLRRGLAGPLVPLP